MRWLVLAGLVACGPTLEETEAELCALVATDITTDKSGWQDLFRGQTNAIAAFEFEDCSVRVRASGDVAEADVTILGTSSGGRQAVLSATCEFSLFDAWELDGCVSAGVEDLP